MGVKLDGDEAIAVEVSTQTRMPVRTYVKTCYIANSSASGGDAPFAAVNMALAAFPDLLRD